MFEELENNVIISVTASVSASVKRDHATLKERMEERFGIIEYGKMWQKRSIKNGRFCNTDKWRH